MIVLGNNITSASDMLTPIKASELHRRIVQPPADFVNTIARLRAMREFDSKLYAQTKRSLPYIVCGSFSPPFRRRENFAYTNCFVIDIDHISDNGLDLTAMRQRLQADDRVGMLFASPSGDGLKAIFLLKKKCYDMGEFSLFYKKFLSQLALQHHLDGAIDTRTSDVTRACFLSHDPEAYINLHPTLIDMEQWVDTNDVFTALNEDKELTKKEKEQAAKNDDEKSAEKEPDDDTLQKIKQLLSHKKQEAKPLSADIRVPVILDKIISELEAYINHIGLVHVKTENIHYGKKIHIRYGMRQGEINLFYGKKGFSVVQSPKHGTSDDLNQIAADAIICFLQERGLA